MTQDLTTAGPSRRSIAKGAAWAVPAVSVAAAAPTLAASAPEECRPQIRVNCPPPLTTQQLTFTITNPSSNSCTIPTDTPFTVNRGGLAGVNVGPLNSINAGVNVIFDTANSGRLTAPLAPGQSVTFQVFPRGLATVSLLQNVSVTMEGVSAAQGYTIIRLLGLSVAICGLG